jgi:hypothetical protein
MFMRELAGVVGATYFGGSTEVASSGLCGD